MASQSVRAVENYIKPFHLPSNLDESSIESDEPMIHSIYFLLILRHSLKI